MRKPNISKSKKRQNAGAKQERRFLSNGELRVQSDNNGKKIVGYAAKFSPTLSGDLGGFREQLDPHCFDACLAGSVDCRALWNHSPLHVLGRTTSGTLRLSVDNIGLRYVIDPPDTQLSRDLIVSMERGDVTQSSFGFFCLEDDWSQDASGGIIRTILKADLFDVSPVTYPAYPDATSGVHSLRSCPADIRSKLSKRDEEDDDDEQDEGDDECNPDSDSYDPEADCDEEDREICSACGQPIRNEEDETERQAHLNLIARLLHS